MSDLFHEKVKDEWIERILRVMWRASKHTFQVLTKRPERMQAWLSRTDTDIYRELGFNGVIGLEWPLPNVWWGVSVEDQATADARIPLLLQTPAAVRWVSYEPALSYVDFTRWLYPEQPLDADYRPTIPASKIHGLDWLVCGGESGPGARHFDLTWARSAIAQCRAAGVACFVKQMGSRPTSGDPYDFPDMWRFKDRKGADPSEWPEDLRGQEWPR